MLFPLVIVDERLGELDFSDMRVVSPEAVAEPYHGLLVHPHHMTVQVEQYYGEPVDVSVVAARREGDFYQRKILLTLQRSKKVVQFGLVRLDLTCLDEAVKNAILEEKTPLGRVLIEHNVLRRVEPTSFVEVRPAASMQAWFGLAQPQILHGRTGVIFCNDRPAIAVLEILAPAE